MSDSPKLKWGCSECRGEDFADQDINRESRNCSGEHPKNVVTDQAAPGLYRCPWQQIDAWVWWVVSLWSEWKAGFGLPWSSVSEAPAYIWQALHECESAANEYQSKRQRQSTKGNKATLWQNEE